MRQSSFCRYIVCLCWKVIEEIEEMMQESPDLEDDETPSQSDRLSMLSQEIQTLQRSSTSSYEESKRLPGHGTLAAVVRVEHVVWPPHGALSLTGGRVVGRV